MSGTYQAWSADAPGGGAAATAAQVQAGLAASAAAAASRQLDAERFILTNRHGALPGHAPVVGSYGDPGSDPDLGTPDASDSSG
jgi:hypothetical protein